ncbi:MAG TPA: FAD:protein FMN transferase [Mycobacteriales bacterium]|jgi:thiamine biosynthesis lipoprotein|nr:FAD:protein FMN transferase [Mycobacteriales bacterium]
MSAPTIERRTAADFEALGTRVRLVVTDAGQLPAARRILDAELAAIDAACSRFRPDSELARLDAADGAEVRLSPLLTRALAAGLDAAAATDGLVDPTVGSAMVELGYDRDFSLLAPNGTSVRVVRRPVPGWRRIELDRSTGIARVPRGIRIDLGATAKALAADLAAARIHDALGCGVLVGLGGDIATAGTAPDSGWTIRVQDVTGPVDEAVDGPTETVCLHEGALATSSTMARRWVRGGRLLHHILDPRSGLPVASTWRTVSVAAPTCLAANVASTASIVRGAEAPAWLTQRGFAARLVDQSGDVVRTAGWPQPAGLVTP